MDDPRIGRAQATNRARPKWIAGLFRLGIRQKMVLALVIVLSLALGTTTWLTIEQQEENILRETQRHGEDVVRIVSQALAYSIVGYDYHTIQLLLEEIVKSHDIGYARVLSKKGNVMAESGKTPGSGDNWTMFSKDVVFDKQPVGRVIIGLDNGEIINRLETQKRSIIFREVLIIILIAVGEFLALSYIIIRPVSIISNSLDKGIDETGKITHHIPLVSKDEFGRLAVLFNQLREQLNKANVQLQSKIDLADAKLIENNSKLLEQAEDLRRMNEELKHVAITDPLTGLHNRRSFVSMVETDLAFAIRHRDVSSILMIDIDHFKQVNDSHGHITGDMVLIEVAAILNKSLRKSDLVCRMGGEEFVVLCRRTNKDESLGIAEKIRRSIETHGFIVGADRLAVTVSIGVVSVPDGGGVRTVGEYFHCADLAMYRSKAAGRNCVTHFADIGKSAAG